jgi:predicted metal-dependent peptidase
VVNKDILLNVTVPTDKEITTAEATTLKKAFEEIIVSDSRCKGIALFLRNIDIFWSHKIDTACAGHGFIFFNPDFYNKIPKETRITVMVHEVWHLILKHISRGEGFNPVYYNIAADHVINLILEKEGFTFHGVEPYKDKQYTNMSTEQIYEKIYEKNKKQNKKPKKCLKDLSNYISKEKIESLIKDVIKTKDKGVDIDVKFDEQKKKANLSVDHHLKSIGSSSKIFSNTLCIENKRIVIKDAKYEDIFSKYLTDPLSGGKRTFVRPNRRQHGITKNNLIMPGKLKRKGKKNRLKHLVYALDVSGSLTNIQKQQSHNAVKNIKDILNPFKLTVLFFNTRIVFEKTFTDTDNYGDITIFSGGGTCLIDVYKRTKQLKPEALVIFTDLCLKVPAKPAWDTIWFITDKNHCNIPNNIYGDLYYMPKIK